MVDWARGCWVLSSFGRASCAGFPPERGDERSEPGLGLAARSAGVALQAWNPLAFSSPLGGRWYAPVDDGVSARWVCTRDVSHYAFRAQPPRSWRCTAASVRSRASQCLRWARECFLLAYWEIYMRRAPRRALGIPRACCNARTGRERCCSAATRVATTGCCHRPGWTRV